MKAQTQLLVDRGKLPASAEQAEKSPDAFLKAQPPPLIIDEVQYAPALFRHLKATIDADRKPGRFMAIETKFAENPAQDDLKGFKALEGFYGENSMISGWLACRTPQPYPMASGITAVPASRI